MNSENYEESDYGLDLNLLTILYQPCVLYPRKSGLMRQVTI